MTKKPSKFSRGPRARRLAIYRAAIKGRPGCGWYQRACRELRVVARQWGLPPEYVAAAMAATSPLTPVISSPRMARGGGKGSNIGKARKVLKHQARLQAGDWGGSRALNPRSPGLARLVAFEAAMLDGLTPRAALDVAFPHPETVKTHAFVRNLLGDTSYVTVDTLIARGAGLKKTNGSYRVTKAVYKVLAEDIRAVARDLGWAPAEVMAAAWTGWGGSGAFTLATLREARRQAGRASRGCTVPRCVDERT